MPPRAACWCIPACQIPKPRDRKTAPAEEVPREQDPRRCDRWCGAGRRRDRHDAPANRRARRADRRVPEAAEEAGSAAAAQKTRADGLEKELEGVTTKKKEIEKRLEVASKAESKLADTAAEADKKAKALEAAQKKLAGAMKGLAAVAVDGDGLRVTIDTGLLFVRDDLLSDRGKQIVERVGAALKEMSDKDTSVAGHTDDTPLPVPRPPASAPPPKKGARPAPAPPAPPPVRFATNWELSAGRAVAVVRHLQEASKIDPSRLSAAGYGQYRPSSRRDKAVNRRIGIVLSPRPKK